MLKPRAPDDPTPPPVQRDESTLLERSVHDGDVVVGTRPGRPVGSCGRTDHSRTTAPARTARPPRRRVDLGQQPSSRVLAHGQGVVPVLDPHHLAVECDVRPAGHITGGNDAWRGESRGVAQHAVVDGQTPSPAASPCSGRRRCRRPQGWRRSPRHRRGGPAPRALDCPPRCDRRPRRGGHRLRARGAGRRTLLRSRIPSTRQSGTGSASTSVTSRSEAATRGRHLGSDEAAADHHDPRPRPRAPCGWRCSHRACGACGRRPSRPCPGAAGERRPWR